MKSPDNPSNLQVLSFNKKGKKNVSKSTVDLLNNLVKDIESGKVAAHEVMVLFFSDVNGTVEWAVRQNVRSRYRLVGLMEDVKKALLEAV